MTDERLITTTDALTAFCAELAREPYITLDTEFIREKTYFPRLCLAQIAGPHSAKAIDPLAEGMDLAPLYELLHNPGVLKVLHAGRQDLEIFYHATAAVPTPLFDTQIAAQAAGFGESVSYSELIQRLLNIRIDKASRFTDWARRPLSERQMDYALDDVIHLREAYEVLRGQLEAQHRLAWVEEEMQALYEPEQYVTHPEDAWKRLKPGNMRPKQLAGLQTLAAWREEEATRRNVPRNMVLRDEVLLEIAASLPQTREELLHIRNMDRLSPKLHEPLLSRIQAVLALPPESWPKIPTRKGPPPEAAALSEILQLLLKLRAAEAQIIPRMIASREELEAFAGGERAVRFLHGWRHELFGQFAEQLLQGRLHIGYDPQNKRIIVEE